MKMVKMIMVDRCIGVGVGQAKRSSKSKRFPVTHSHAVSVFLLPCTLLLHSTENTEQHVGVGYRQACRPIVGTQFSERASSLYCGWNPNSDTVLLRCPMIICLTSWSS